MRGRKIIVIAQRSRNWGGWGRYKVEREEEEEEWDGE